jgi:hypothetical protein
MLTGEAPDAPVGLFAQSTKTPPQDTASHSLWLTSKHRGHVTSSSDNEVAREKRGMQAGRQHSLSLPAVMLLVHQCLRYGKGKVLDHPLGADNLEDQLEIDPATGVRIEAREEVLKRERGIAKGSPSLSDSEV